MTIKKVEYKLIKIFKEKLKLKINKKDRNKNLYEEGILDSFEIMRLICVLEDTFKIEIDLSKEKNFVPSFLYFQKYIVKKIK